MKFVLLGALAESHSHSFSGCWANSTLYVEFSADNTNWYTAGSLTVSSPAPGGAGSRDDYSKGSISGINYMQYIRLNVRGNAGGSGSCPIDSYGDAKVYEISIFY